MSHFIGLMNVLQPAHHGKRSCSSSWETQLSALVYAPSHSSAYSITFSTFPIAIVLPVKYKEGEIKARTVPIRYQTRHQGRLRITFISKSKSAHLREQFELLYANDSCTLYPHDCNLILFHKSWPSL